MNPAAAIGVFDSGIGGLTVVRALRRALPASERLVYLGDTARVPYGTRSEETVVRYALEGARFLAGRGIKALVVACNTMSAVALQALKDALDIPIVGVIGPGAEAACRATRRQAIGVIGTAATIRSGAYARAIAHHLPQARVVSRACPLFVPLAEEGWVDNDVARATAAAYLSDLGDGAIDTLVLGCTHYPLLAGVIGKAVGPGVTLVDSAEATALVVRDRLRERGLLAGAATGSAAGGGGAPGGGPASREEPGGRGPAGREEPGGEADYFFVTDSSDRFKEVGTRFLGRPLGRLELVEL